MSWFGEQFIIFLCNFFLHLYPFSVLVIVFVYAFMIGLLLLVLAPLHTIQQRWVISLAVITGTAVAILLKTQTSVSVYLTHWTGIFVAVIISRIFLVIFFKRLIGKKNATSNLEVKTSVVLYHNYQYFLYGLCIYIFIFTDRILAWSSTKNGPLPFVVYFEKNYELGMDLAIMVFLLLSGVMEYSIAAFSRFLDVGQKLTNYDTPKEFNRYLKKMYWQNIGLLFATAILVFILIYFIMNASWGYRGQFNEDLLESSVKVCIIGGVGYFLLAWGMLNTLYLFTLGQPAKPLRAIFYGCIVNLITGLFLSRFISYEYSVAGMLCGAAVFMILTLKANMKYFKHLDYYYYAAY